MQKSLIHGLHNHFLSIQCTPLSPQKRADDLYVMNDSPILLALALREIRLHPRSSRLLAQPGGPPMRRYQFPRLSTPRPGRKLLLPKSAVPSAHWKTGGRHSSEDAPSWTG